MPFPSQLGQIAFGKGSPLHLNKMLLSALKHMFGSILTRYTLLNTLKTAK